MQINFDVNQNCIIFVIQKGNNYDYCFDYRCHLDCPRLACQFNSVGYEKNFKKDSESNHPYFLGISIQYRIWCAVA